MEGPPRLLQGTSLPHLPPLPSLAAHYGPGKLIEDGNEAEGDKTPEGDLLESDLLVWGSHG